MDTLLSLLDISGVSGNEDDVRNYILEKLASVNPVVDSLGNIFVYLPVSPQAKTILITAHIDEVGMIVSHIDKETGRIYVYMLGGLQIEGAIGEEVTIQTEKGYINGIVTTEWISNFNKKDDKIKIEDIYIDTGLSYNDLMSVEVGSFVSFVRKAKILNNNLIVGKAIDDRFGCYLLMELIKNLKEGRIFSPNNLLFLFTVREELLQKGLLNDIKQWPIDLMIALDTVNANEHYDHSKVNTRFVGNGPILVLYNKAGLTDPKFNHYIQSLAREYKIPLQFALQTHGDTDIHRIQSIIPDSGPATILSIAVKNVHTAFSIASLNDIQNLSSLLNIIISM